MNYVVPYALAVFADSTMLGGALEGSIARGVRLDHSEIAPQVIRETPLMSEPTTS